MSRERQDVGTLTEDIFLEISPDHEYSTIERIFVFLSVIVVCLTLPLSIFFIVMVATEYERVVVLRLGKVHGERSKGPGLVLFIPCVDSTFIVDLRIETITIPPQEILTKDSCSVVVDAVVFFRVINPLSAVVRVYDYEKATLKMAASVLRNVLGQENILDIFSERTKLAMSMKKILDHMTRPWGVLIERVEMKEVRLPEDMQRAMAAEAEATREARAKIIVAEGELKASEAMREASEIIGDNDAALHMSQHKTWDKVKMKEAVTALKKKEMGLLKESKTFNVPRSTLKDYVKNH